MPSDDPPAGTRISYSRQFRRCNKPDCPTCQDGGTGHGPYWYATWRQGGRKRSRYLGKAPPAEATVPLGPAPPDKAAHPALQVRTLGGFAVWRGGELVPERAWRSRAVTALFKCLLDAPRHRLHRELLVDRLWPQAVPSQGAKLLRQALYLLRRVLGAGAAGGEYLRLEGETLVLEPAPGAQPPDGWLDAPAFAAAASAALAGSSPRACRDALALYGGEYLPEDRYEEWTVARREELREQHLALLLHLAALREGQGVLGEAARCLRAVLALDPCHEPAARALLRVEAAAGHYAGAVRVYQQLTAALARELGVAPESQTEEDYQAMLAGRQTAARQHSNLPTPATSFLGREQDLALLQGRLSGTPVTGGRARLRTVPDAPRLITITGAGGCGKTRLAIELGHELRAYDGDGVWLLELAALPRESPAAPAPIAEQAAAVLGLRQEPGQSPAEAVCDYLGPRRVLLILDNCEHVLDGCAAFAIALLGACPRLQLLATSRQALGVLGESSWPLAALPLPPAGDEERATPEDLAHYAAVRMLVERARDVKPGFGLTLDNRRAVVAICRQLDGIPLAIELAAAQLAQISAAALAARLGDQYMARSCQPE